MIGFATGKCFLGPWKFSFCCDLRVSAFVLHFIKESTNEEYHKQFVIQEKQYLQYYRRRVDMKMQKCKEMREQETYSTYV